MTRPRARCSVSIDLDPIRCYYRIHGLGEPPEELRATIMRRAVPRFAQLFAARGIVATFFVVGEDLDPSFDAHDARAAHALLGELVAAGHELGNHSHRHPYELARLGAERVADEIGRCDALLRTVDPRPVAGFRAPGYDLSPVMVAELLRRGYSYDSSIFPAPGYYAAKAAVMGALAALGRPSGAVMTNPRALVAPTDPYRPSPKAPWRRGQAAIVELPIAVTPWLRLPAIGTNLLIAPRAIRDRVVDAMLGRSFFNLELHGIDLADADLDGIPGELVARQPDLRVPLAAKQAALGAILDRVLARADVITLRDAAAWAQREAA
ncbi:MAG: polysaccharide deacetylase family protein [Deltaproteobacteria bacterium]|nr:polysaccharide deacetylase family protein [Deltaproteobacteria bacterium]